MGWLFTNGQTKEQLIQRCLYGGASPSDFRRLDHSVVGNNLWVVFERKPEAPTSRTIGYANGESREYPIPERFLALYLLDGSGEGWGYKDMDESMGPCETNCPQRLIDMVPDPGSYATAWRARVKAQREASAGKRRSIKALQLGQKVQLVEGCKPPVVTIASLKPLRGYGEDGRLYRIQPRHVAA